MYVYMYIYIHIYEADSEGGSRAFRSPHFIPNMYETTVYPEIKLRII